MMSTATEHAGDFFMRLCLSDDGLGYPNRVGVVAADIGDVAKYVWEALDDEDTPIVVIDGDGRETLVSHVSRLQRFVDRARGRSRIRVERRVDGRCTERWRTDRATLERELLRA
jgi:hypothetical protein